MILEIHAQEYPHAKVLIHGTRDGLTTLRNALTQFLHTYANAATAYGVEEETFFAGDGEGYHIEILMTSELAFGGTEHYTHPEYRG